MRLHLRHGSVRHAQEVGKILIGVTAESLSDISHDGFATPDGRLSTGDWRLLYVDDV
jgi:hypothetical protein